MATILLTQEFASESASKVYVANGKHQSLWGSCSHRISSCTSSWCEQALVFLRNLCSNQDGIESSGNKTTLFPYNLVSSTLVWTELIRQNRPEGSRNRSQCAELQIIYVLKINPENFSVMTRALMSKEVLHRFSFLDKPFSLFVLLSLGPPGKKLSIKPYITVRRRLFTTISAAVWPVGKSNQCSRLIGHDFDQPVIPQLHPTYLIPVRTKD